MLWLHLIGHSEDEFLELAQFSQKGEGAGLNAIVAKGPHPRASPTDRSHVHKIRFSAEPADIKQRPVLDNDLMIRKANSLSGLCYDVPNPFCRFTLDVDVEFPLAVRWHTQGRCDSRRSRCRSAPVPGHAKVLKSNTELCQALLSQFEFCCR